MPNTFNSTDHTLAKPVMVATMPKHIAIIMDGNNRYGKANHLPMGAGHLAGKDALNPIVEYCAKNGVQVLTVFAFSSENWSRPKNEVDLLMRLLAETIQEQLSRMTKHKIRLRFIGDRSLLDRSLQEKMADIEAKTANFTTMTLAIAVSYGGKDDIAFACKKIAQKVANGTISVDDIDANMVGENVELGDLPAVDMLIRTGGDFRISNFLLWQSAYAELFFTPTLWPEFGVDELESMIHRFAKIERRFGKTSEQILEEKTAQKNSMNDDNKGVV